MTTIIEAAATAELMRRGERGDGVEGMSIAAWLTASAGVLGLSLDLLGLGFVVYACWKKRKAVKETSENQPLNDEEIHDTEKGMRV